MKKNFITVFAIGLSLIACKKEPVLNNDNTPEEGTEYIQEYIVPVSLSVSGEVSKAFYDENLSVKWEENDQILAMKGKITAPTSNGTVTHKTIEGDHLLTLSDIKESTAEFEGQITTAYEGNAIWHFVYPASAGSMETSCRRYTVVFTTAYENITAVNVSIPASQNGVWTPYSYCASANVSDDALLAQSIAFQPLSACYAVRLFEEDGTTPKKAKKVTLISPANNLVGSFTGSTKADKQDGIPAAIPSFAFNGTGNTIEANVEGVAAKQDGVYEYRINVPAGNLGELTLQITDENDAVITRSIPAFDLAAGHMKAFKVKWDPEIDDTYAEFTSVANPKTTYGYYLVGEVDKANTAGMGKAAFDGTAAFNATSSRGAYVKEYGVKYMVDKDFDLEDPDLATSVSYNNPSGAILPQPVSFSFSVDNIALGVHKLSYVAYVEVNNSIFYSDVQVCENLVITGLPYNPSFDYPRLTGVDSWSVTGSTSANTNNQRLYITSTGGGNPQAYSPYFFAPENLKITFLTKVIRNSSGLGNNSKLTITFKDAGNNITSTLYDAAISKSATLELDTDNSAAKDYALPEGTNRVSYEHKYGSWGPGLDIYYCTLLYR